MSKKKIALIETVLQEPILFEEKELPQGVLCRVTYPVCNIGVKNQNNRIYRKEVWEKVLKDNNILRKLKDRTLFGHAEHPETTQSNLEKTSHIVSNLWIDEKENKVKATLDVLDTPYGRIIDTLLKAGSKVGVSTRADGELKEEIDEEGNKYYDVVPEAYRFVTIDFTADPSTLEVLPEKIDRNLIQDLKAGIESKKIDADFAVALCEKLNTPEAMALVESIKKESVREGVEKYSDEELAKELAEIPNRLAACSDTPDGRKARKEIEAYAKKLEAELKKREEAKSLSEKRIVEAGRKIEKGKVYRLLWPLVQVMEFRWRYPDNIEKKSLEELEEECDTMITLFKGDCLYINDIVKGKDREYVLAAFNLGREQEIQPSSKRLYVIPIYELRLGDNVELVRFKEKQEWEMDESLVEQKGTEFDFEIGEEVEVRNLVSKIAEAIKLCLVQNKVIKETDRVVIPEGAYDYGVENNEPTEEGAYDWSFTGDFEVYGEDPNKVILTGEVWVFGLFSEEVDGKVDLGGMVVRIRDEKVSEARTIGLKGKAKVRELVKKAKEEGLTGFGEITDYVIENMPDEILKSWEGAHSEIGRLVQDILGTEIIKETIKKEGSKWVVYAESGRKMGEYDTKQEALKRLRQIEYFKRKNEGLEKGFGLQGKKVKIVKGDHAGQTGVIQSETGYTEGYGVVVKIKLDSGEIVEYPADFWEEIKEGYIKEAGSKLTVADFKPGEYALYSDGGISDLVIIRILPWPSDKPTAETPAKTVGDEEKGIRLYIGPIRHDKRRSVYAESVISFLKHDTVGSSAPGTKHFYTPSNLYKSFEDVIKAHSYFYPYVILKQIKDMEPHFDKLKEFGLIKDEEAIYKMMEELEKKSGEVHESINETGEMSQRDIEPGGEYYEWAKAIEDEVKKIEKLTSGKLKFREMQPFDAYREPYAVTNMGYIWDVGVEGEKYLYMENVEWVGTAEQLAKAIKGDKTAINLVTYQRKKLAGEPVEPDFDPAQLKFPFAEGKIDEKVIEKFKRIIEAEDYSKVGSGKLPNKYYVTAIGDFLIETEDSVFDWASGTEYFGKDWKPVYKEIGIFNTYKEAKEAAQRVIDEIPSAPEKDTINTVTIEDHLTGELMSAGLVGVKVKEPYRFEFEVREDIGFTKEKMEKAGLVFESIKFKKGIKEQRFIARGIEKKEDAEKLARDKKGVVSQDPKDPKKFAVVVEEGKFSNMMIDIEDDARELLSQGKSNEEIESILLDKYKPYLSANLAKEIIGKASADVLGKKVSEGKIQEADYLTLVKFFEENFTKIPEESRKRITTLLVDSRMKELRDLEIRLAEVKAEKEKLKETVSDYKDKLKILILEKEKLNRSLKEAINRQESILKEKEAKILEYSKKLQEAKTEYDKKLQETKIDFEKKLEENRKETIRKYIRKKLTESGLAKLIPSGTQALLEKCSSEEEVDAVLDKVRDTLREATLHSGVGSELLVSREEKPNPVYERINQIMSGMFGIKEGK